MQSHSRGINKEATMIRIHILIWAAIVWVGFWEVLP